MHYKHHIEVKRKMELMIIFQQRLPVNVVVILLQPANVFSVRIYPSSNSFNGKLFSKSWIGLNVWTIATFQMR